jgi:hypothetical protein
VQFVAALLRAPHQEFELKSLFCPVPAVKARKFASIDVLNLSEEMGSRDSPWNRNKSG